MAKNVKIGIIGMGKIGTVHAEAFRNTTGAEVTALCDVCPEILKEKGRRFGVDALFGDYRKMLRDADIDAVIVGTPNFTHCPTTLDALRAGKHVLCEKPMALNARQAARMLAAAKKARKALHIGMTWRRRADSKLAKEYVAKGLLGRIYHMRFVLRRRRGIPGLGGWFTTKSLSGGGVLIDIGVHFLDLCMWITDNWKPERVSTALHSGLGAPMKDYLFTSMWAGPPRYDGTFDVDDYATGIVRFPNNLTLSFELAWAANCDEGNFIEILGNKGGLRLADKNGLILFSEHNRHIADIRPHLPEVQVFPDQARAFVNAVRNKRKPQTSAEQGVAVMKLLDAIRKSSELRKEISLPRR